MAAKTEIDLSCIIGHFPWPAGVGEITQAQQAELQRGGWEVDGDDIKESRHCDSVLAGNEEELGHLADRLASLYRFLIGSGNAW